MRDNADAIEQVPELRPIRSPTLYIGQFASSSKPVAESLNLCVQVRIELLPGATHWLHHEKGRTLTMHL
jgi:pimeloyl-ACP methyl ester carboxylesterase